MEDFFKIKSPVDRLHYVVLTKMINESGFVAATGSLKKAYDNAARRQVDHICKTMRSLHDADPNWTDEQVCQKILDTLDAKYRAKHGGSDESGHGEVRCGGQGPLEAD